MSVEEIQPYIDELISVNDKILAVTIIRPTSNEIVYQTNNWDITADIANIMSAWSSNQPSINITGVKYSSISITPDRLIATNIGGQGHICISKSQVKDRSMIIVCYLTADGNAQAGYIDSSRAMNNMLLNIPHLQ